MKPGQSACGCGKAYWSAQAWQHERCAPVVVDAASNAAVSQSEAVSQSSVSQSSTYRNRDEAARRVYMRDLMRSKRRAAKRVAT